MSLVSINILSKMADRQQESEHGIRCVRLKRNPRSSKFSHIFCYPSQFILSSAGLRPDQINTMKTALKNLIDSHGPNIHVVCHRYYQRQKPHDTQIGITGGVPHHLRGSAEERAIQTLQNECMEELCLIPPRINPISLVDRNTSAFLLPISECQLLSAPHHCDNDRVIRPDHKVIVLPFGDKDELVRFFSREHEISNASDRADLIDIVCAQDLLTIISRWTPDFRESFPVLSCTPISRY